MTAIIERRRIGVPERQCMRGIQHAVERVLWHTCVWALKFASGLRRKVSELRGRHVAPAAQGRESTIKTASRPSSRWIVTRVAQPTTFPE